MPRGVPDRLVSDSAKPHARQALHPQCPARRVGASRSRTTHRFPARACGGPSHHTQKLAHAGFGKKRGAFVGRIDKVGHDWVEVSGGTSVKPGDGIVFDTGGNTDREQGGRVYEVKGPRLLLQRGKIDFAKLKTGDRVWKTDDPALNATLQSSYQREQLPTRKTKVRWTVRGAAGEPLVPADPAPGVAVVSSIPPEVADNPSLAPIGIVPRQQL